MFVDIMPTVTDLAGLLPPPACDLENADILDACTDGVSLRPLWKSPTQEVHEHALSLYPRPNMNDKASMGYSMVTRAFDRGSQLRYTEWINITLIDERTQTYQRHWDQLLGVELYNHSASGFGWSALENVNIVSRVSAGLRTSLSMALRTAWA